MATFQPQQQQPVQVVYPNPLAKQPSHHHSNGSFGTVLIVLAVIAAVSAVACFLGRLCNRRLVKAQTTSKPNKQLRTKDHHGQARVHEPAGGVRANREQGDVGFFGPDRPDGPRDHQAGRPNKAAEGDIEFGFDMRASSAKLNNNNIDNDNNSMSSGSRGHVAFERNGDPPKHHGGGAGEHHDYYGGPRASD